MKPWPCGTSRAVICSQISCTSSALGLTRSNFEFHSHWFQLGAGRLSCQEPCQGPHLGAMDHLYFPTLKPFSRASLGDLAPLTTSACMGQNWYSVKEITNPLFMKRALTITIQCPPRIKDFPPGAMSHKCHTFLGHFLPSVHTTYTVTCFLIFL